jgi:hypothetical protein
MTDEQWVVVCLNQEAYIPVVYGAWANAREASTWLDETHLSFRLDERDDDDEENIACRDGGTALDHWVVSVLDEDQ